MRGPAAAARDLTWVTLVLVLALLLTGTARAGSCLDNDGDGFGVSGDPSCPGGPTPDCDDTDASVFPGAPELCDGLSNDCDDPAWPSIHSSNEHFIGNSFSSPSYAMAAADLDGDADPDVATGRFGELRWYDNATGDAASWIERTIPTPTWPVAGWERVEAGDMDGDGDADLLALDGSSDLVAWFENPLGEGTNWQEHLISENADHPSALQTADVDGDDDLDVVVASTHADSIRWFENSSGGGIGWVEHSVSTSVTLASSVYVTDLDGDGDLDVVSTSGTQDFDEAKIYWHENTLGDGSVWADHVVQEGVTRGRSVFAADVDGDLDLDVISTAGSRLAWHENTTFAGGTPVWTYHEIAGALESPVHLYVADLDSDSDLDVLLDYRGDLPYGDLPGLSWYENKSGDGIDWSEHLLAKGGSSSYVDLVAVDLDGDDNLDALASQQYRGEFWYELLSLERDDDGDGLSECEGDCDDATTDCLADCTDADGDGARGCDGDCDENNPGCTFDCTDADGDSFCPSIDCDDSEGSVYPGAPESCDGLNNDCDHPAWPALEAWIKTDITSNCCGFSGDVVSADIDGDGDEDVVTAPGQQVRWYENVAGDGSEWISRLAFDGEPSDPDDQAWIPAIAVADLDGDSDLDIVVAVETFFARYLRAVMNNSGDGTSWSERTIGSAVPGFMTDVDTGDLDGDGDVDVLVARYDTDGRDAVWFENLWGPGSSWGERTIDSAMTDLNGIVAADVDGDGDLDAVSSSWGDDAVYWHENVGFGPSALTTTIGSMGDGADLQAADVDGDGDLDVAAILDYQLLSWFDNAAGDGSSWIQRVIAGVAATGGVGLAAGDVDGDGDLDFVTGSDGHEQIVFYENTAGDGISWSSEIISDDSENNVGFIDVDGDGFLEVLGRGDSPKPLGWFRFESVFVDEDRDHVTNCDGDCDDANPNCALDCTDTDADGYCVTHDCDDTKFHCDVNCADADADDFCVTSDCDDTVASCTVDCADADLDGVRFCDGDCDESDPDCTFDCADADFDGVRICDGDCDESNPYCTLDCTDADGDGYCVGIDCDETSLECNEDCADSDGDGFRVCDGDCDNADPQAYPGLDEICTDTADNDCDGLADADDARCSGLVATALLFDEEAALAWSPALVADSYGLYRGRIPATGWSGFNHLCAATQLAGAAAVDPSTPQSGEAFYYLVTGQAIDLVADEFVGGPLGLGPAPFSRPDSTTIPCGSRAFVDPDVVSSVHDGLSWATAYSSVADALTRAPFEERGLEAWVRGTVIDDHGSFPVVGRPGVLVLGGFDGGEALQWERSPEANPSVWNGNPVLPLINSSGASVVLDGMTFGNAESVVFADPAGGLTQLTDVTIAQISGYAIDLVARQSGPSRLVVHDATVEAGGQGAVRAIVEAGSLTGTVQGNTFRGAAAAALRIEARTAVGADVRLDIVGNRIEGGAQGIVLGAHVNDAAATASNRSFVGRNLIHDTTGNSIVVEASGDYASASGPSLVESSPLIVGNTLAGGGGAGISCTAARTGLVSDHEVRCTAEIWDNLVSFNSGPGIAESADDAATGLVADPVVVGNGLFGNLLPYVDEGTTNLVTVDEVNTLPGNYDNFTGDPLYVDPGADDYHLKPGTVLGWASGMRYRSNSSDPGIGGDWTEPLFDDTGWLYGAYGIGYDVEGQAGGLILTAVPAGASSVYTRVRFELADPGSVQELILGIDHDDGYVVWLNGVEVDRSASMPPGAVEWNTAATSHESSNSPTPAYVDVEISLLGLSALQTGTNLLAIGVWNDSAASPDLVLAPRLTLNADSPAIDAGHDEAPGAASRDIDGEPSISDGNRDAIARPDAGADERTP